MKKPTLTASRNSKPTTSQPATLDPQAAAAGFLQTNQLAFHDDPKRFFIFVEKQQAWHPITINQLHRRLKNWALDTHHSSVSAAALKKMVAELEVAAPCWSPALKPGQLVVANGVLNLPMINSHGSTASSRLPTTQSRMSSISHTSLSNPPPCGNGGRQR